MLIDRTYKSPREKQLEIDILSAARKVNKIAQLLDEKISNTSREYTLGEFAFMRHTLADALLLLDLEEFFLPEHGVFVLVDELDGCDENFDLLE